MTRDMWHTVIWCYAHKTLAVYNASDKYLNSIALLHPINMSLFASSHTLQSPEKTLFIEEEIIEF